MGETRLRLADLFCGPGGAAVGYARAGFEVVGFDIRRQPYYPYEFHRADALTVDLAGFDAVHASPPCQGYSYATFWRGDPNPYPRLIDPVREMLAAARLPYVIENVRQGDMRDPLMLCGSWFGLQVRRHRYFECSFPVPFRLHVCQHDGCLPFMHKAERAYADAMGCTWAPKLAARSAIPPAFTEYLGGHLLAHLRATAPCSSAPPVACLSTG